VDNQRKGGDELVRIGELSRATGVSTRALRYYEEQGLIAGERLPNGYRDYRPEAVEMVEFIQDLFAAGLSSEILRDIMPCITDGHAQTSCADLVVLVGQVRDSLLNQERRIRARREKLEQYLSGQRTPRGSYGAPQQ
jgi:DNA-binding transcriptional MerR regulator